MININNTGVLDSALGGAAGQNSKYLITRFDGVTSQKDYIAVTKSLLNIFMNINLIKDLNEYNTVNKIIAGGDVSSSLNTSEKARGDYQVKVVRREPKEIEQEFISRELERTYAGFLDLGEDVKEEIRKLIWQEAYLSTLVESLFLSYKDLRNSSTFKENDWEGLLNIDIKDSGINQGIYTIGSQDFSTAAGIESAIIAAKTVMEYGTADETFVVVLPLALKQMLNETKPNTNGATFASYLQSMHNIKSLVSLPTLFFDNIASHPKFENRLFLVKNADLKPLSLDTQAVKKMPKQNYDAVDWLYRTFITSVMEQRGNNLAIVGTESPLPKAMAKVNKSKAKQGDDK